MNFFCYNALIFSILLLFSAQKTTACGYDWVGECSSAVHLRINGTLDSFDIADCPSGIRFNGLHLGTLQSLALANAKTITWESCINNVSAVNLQYRVYEQGGAVGNFQSLGLAQDYATLLGPYTTRYRSQASNIDLSTGLTVGQTYVLEVYFLAEVDTIGDDFIPETSLLKNNNGQNYRLTFTYGGPTAHPFVVIPTLVKMPKCHGESNGSIGVSVWGDQTGLFYNWSNLNLNFYQQNGLSAGIYTVSVTGANHAESSTIVLGQPDSLVVQFVDIQPVECGGGLGTLTVLATGGTVPYQYLWENGQTTETAGFSSSGTHAVSLTDAHNCLLVQSFDLPSGGDIQQSIAANICTGGSIDLFGSTFSSAGMYTFTVPGNGNCDTLIQLTITEINPGTALSNLPSHILITCTSPSYNLCAEPLDNATFQWSKDGIPATPTLCLLATAGGVYMVQVSLYGCMASKSIAVEEHVVPQPAQFYGRDTITCDGFGTTPTLFRSVTNAVNPTFLWTDNGQFLSSNDSCWFAISDGGFTYTLPDLLVTDIYGCVTNAVGTLLITDGTSAPLVSISTTNASGPNTPDGSATAQVFSGGSFEILWSNGSTEMSIQNLLPGTYCATVTEENGCEDVNCGTVGVAVGTKTILLNSLSVYPNPAEPGDWFKIILPEKFRDQKIEFALSGYQGKTVMEQTFVQNTEILQLKVPENTQAGVYIIRIFSEKGSATGKIILK
ncbi:MAG: T9SS type A sorting domain-containing protein [Saprospiraceae bacterium]